MERSWSPPSICSIGDIPQRNRLQFARRSLIESGLIYTSMTIIVFLTNVCGSEAIYVTNAAVGALPLSPSNLLTILEGGPNHRNCFQFDNHEGCRLLPGSNG